MRPMVGHCLPMVTRSVPNRTPLDDASLIPLGSGSTGRYGLCPVGSILENKYAVRTHSKRHVKKIGRAMRAAGALPPLIIDETYTLIAGHGRLAAAKDNGDGFVPVVQVLGLSEAQSDCFSYQTTSLLEEQGSTVVSSLSKYLSRPFCLRKPVLR